MTTDPAAARPQGEGLESDRHWLRLAIDHAQKTWDPAGSWQHHLARTLQEFGFSRRADPGWIATSERMPETDHDVLVYVQMIGVDRWTCMSSWNAQYKTWAGVGPYTVNHWMPLPEPPEADDANPQAQGGAGT